MKRMLPSLIAALASLGLASQAMASQAYLVDSTDLYAGPDVDYPQLEALPGGVTVGVYGCTDGWQWCDVDANGDRGWVSGEFLQFDYQNQRVLLPSYGAQIGIPIVAFSLGVYWDQHYRSRPWFAQRDEWSHRTFAHRPPPRPAHVDLHPNPGHPAPTPHPTPIAHPAPHGGPAGRTRTDVHPTPSTSHAIGSPPRAAEHPAPSRPAPAKAVTHSPAKVTEHPATAPRAAHPAPAPRPKAAPAPHKEAAPKPAEKKDDGHG